MTAITAGLTSAVFVGDWIPAHDETFDLAEEIAGALERFHAYVTSVRDADQAAKALAELGRAVAYVTSITLPKDPT